MNLQTVLRMNLARNLVRGIDEQQLMRLCALEGGAKKLLNGLFYMHTYIPTCIV